VLCTGAHQELVGCYLSGHQVAGFQGCIIFLQACAFAAWCLCRQRRKHDAATCINKALRACGVGVQCLQLVRASLEGHVSGARFSQHACCVEAATMYHCMYINTLYNDL
jgi:hypothetical protein